MEARNSDSAFSIRIEMEVARQDKLLPPEANHGSLRIPTLLSGSVGFEFAYPLVRLFDDGVQAPSGRWCSREIFMPCKVFVAVADCLEDHVCGGHEDQRETHVYNSEADEPGWNRQRSLNVSVEVKANEMFSVEFAEDEHDLDKGVPTRSACVELHVPVAQWESFGLLLTALARRVQGVVESRSTKMPVCMFAGGVDLAIGVDGNLRFHRVGLGQSVAFSPNEFELLLRTVAKHGEEYGQDVTHSVRFASAVDDTVRTATVTKVEPAPGRVVSRIRFLGDGGDQADADFAFDVPVDAVVGLRLALDLWLRPGLYSRVTLARDVRVVI